MPIAFESLGVRSMCTFVNTPDIRILIDAGLSLGPRFGILPHPKEYEMLVRRRGLLRERAKKSDLITISHYHFDHYTPYYTDTVFIGGNKEEFMQIYQDKHVLLKDIREKVNYGQRRRGWIFQKFLKKVAKNFEIADARSFEFGGTKVKFSNPVFHGEDNSVLGWVLMTSIEANEIKVTHASDIQGPVSNEALRWLLSEKPDVLILGGPPTYLADYSAKNKSHLRAFNNLRELIKKISTIVVDHHLIRALDWKELVCNLQEYAKKFDHRVVTAAEFNNLENDPLEAKRIALYDEFPPKKEFIEWTKLPREKRRHVLPPLT